MCVTIWTGSRIIHTQRELAALVGGLENIVMDDGGLHWGWWHLADAYADCCLCPVDLAATLEPEGWTVERSEGDPMEYELRPIPKPAAARREP